MNVETPSFKVSLVDDVRDSGPLIDDIQMRQRARKLITSLQSRSPESACVEHSKTSSRSLLALWTDSNMATIPKPPLCGSAYWK